MTATAPGLRLSLSADDYQRLALAALAPPRGGDIWDWARGNLRMRDGAAWQPRRAALLRRWYRVAQARLSGVPDPLDPWAHRCEQCWGVAAAQVAKSTWLHTIMLACMVQYPRLMALYMNRIGDLELTLKTKLRPQVERSDALEKLLPRGDESRQQALGARLWTVGVSQVLYLCGSVGDDWRSWSPELMLLDEFDRYPADVDDLGDPIDSGLVRQRTLARTRLLLGSSSPSSISSHAWRRLCGGSHERLLVLCPDCGGAFDLVDARVSLADGDLMTASPPDIITRSLGRYACVHCGALLNSAQIHAAVREAITADRWCPGAWAIDSRNPAGRWTPQADLDSAGRILRLHPAETEVRSWWASALYSVDVSLDTYARDLARSMQGTLKNRQAHTNNNASEPFIVRSEADPLDVQRITAAAVPATPFLWGSAPCAAKWLILFEDQQGQQIEQVWYPWTLLAFDDRGDGWVVEAGASRPDGRDSGDAKIAVVEERYWQIGGTPRRADIVVRDSGNGNLKWHHYAWAAGDPTRRVLAYGQPRLPPGIPWREEVDQPHVRRRTPKPAGVREWSVAPHHWRTETWRRLIGKRPDRRLWLPADAPSFFLESLTSEEQVEETRRVSGGHAQLIVWRPRVINTTSEKTTFREDTHWWDGLNGCVEFDDILRHLEQPADVSYGVVGTIG